MLCEVIMFLVLTEQDLARLSPQLRAELQKLAFGAASIDTGVDRSERYSAPQTSGDEVEFDYLPAWPDAFEKSGAAKTVIDLDEVEARALLANLSAKSVETLKLFASGESVALDALVGDGKGYESTSDLKRSFVGAVNRRLRTVTRNRTAVLFRKIEESKGISIAVRPMTAVALREALSLANVVD
jgi:hypothetical protein